MIVASPSTSAVPSTKPDLKAAAQRFEAVFLREMIATMRKGALAEDVFGSAATDNFRELADAQTAEALAKRGAFGIAALVERQLAGSK